MTQQEMVSDLRETIIAGLKLEDINAADLTPDTTLFGDESELGLDSLDAVELSVVLEKRYGVSFTNAGDVQQAFATLESLAVAVLRLQTAQNA